MANTIKRRAEQQLGSVTTGTVSTPVLKTQESFDRATENTISLDDFSPDPVKDSPGPTSKPEPEPDETLAPRDATDSGGTSGGDTATDRLKDRRDRARQFQQEQETDGGSSAFGINAERGPSGRNDVEPDPSTATRGTDAEGSTSGQASTAGVPTEQTGTPSTQDVSVTGAVSVGFREVMVLLAGVLAFFFLN